jgi:hypothetical protein
VQAHLRLPLWGRSGRDRRLLVDGVRGIHEGRQLILGAFGVELQHVQCAGFGDHDGLLRDDARLTVVLVGAADLVGVESAQGAR